MSLASVEWSEVTGEASVWLVIGSIGVGFNEEIRTRGLLIVGGRARFQREIHVVLLSCLFFGALHIPNALYGRSVGATIGQFVFASLVGVVYYVLRRLTGTLIVPMVLHGAWDGALFTNKFSGEDGPDASRAIFFFVIIVSFVALSQILRERPDVESSVAVEP
jgi:membrane protease YdiL (CAAX protease family)